MDLLAGSWNYVVQYVSGPDRSYYQWMACGDSAGKVSPEGHLMPVYELVSKVVKM
jgi:hypothetical protein